MKFSRRKNCQNILNAKNELRELDMKQIVFPVDNPTIAIQSLCLYNRMLWSKAKRAQSLVKFSSFYVSRATVINISENNLRLPIVHFNDLEKKKFLILI